MVASHSTNSSLTISCTGRCLQRRILSSIYSFKRSLDLGDDSVTVGWDATLHCDALSVAEVSVHSSLTPTPTYVVLPQTISVLLRSVC